MDISILKPKTSEDILETLSSMTVKERVNKLENILDMKHKEFEAEMIIKSLKTNINWQNKYGKTPLILACRHDYVNINMVKLLLDTGVCDVNIADKEGFTALMCVASNYNKHEIAELLINNGANVNAINKNGETALIRAIKIRNFNVIELLIKHNCNVNLFNKNSNPPLLEAIDVKQPKIADLLINAGADITVKDDDKNTPLSLACMYAMASTIELIINKLKKV